MSSKINIGDLVWSESYSRLGVVSKILTDADLGYSETDPAYVLVDPVRGRDIVVSGVREHSVYKRGTSVETHCRLVRLANGFASAQACTQLALHDDKIGY